MFSSIKKRYDKKRDHKIRKKICERRGSMVVEAAIFLPIFIIGIMTLGYLVKFNAVQENVFHSFADETGKLAAEASVNPDMFSYKSDVVNRVNEENKKAVKDAKIKNYLYRIPYMDQTDIIAASVDYDIDIRLPAKFIDAVPASDTIVCRAFVGDQQSIAPMPFSEMEKSVNSDMVWIFPKSGTKYHGENCSFIKSFPKELLLSSQVRNKYSACKTCKPSSLRDGNLVYCFKTGDVYHSGECATVEKYVTSIAKEEATNRGYSPCSRCGG